MTQRADTTPPPHTEVYAFSGEDPAELAATLTRIAGIATSLSDGERRDLACQQARLEHAGPLRVAFAAATEVELARRARHAAQLATRLSPGVTHHEHGVFAGDGARGRVVLLFADPAAAPAGRCDDAAGAATHDEHAAEAAAAYRAARAALRWLDRLGVTPAAAVGHGGGELAALAWAGCLSEPDAADLASWRARALTGCGARGTGMLSISADAATARTLAEGTNVVLAAYNGPHAHVLAGPTAALNAVAERAARCGIAATAVRTRPGLDTAALVGCAAALKDVLDSITFGPARRRVISTVIGRELTPRDDIRALLCEQVTAPVRFHEAVRAAARVADLFCEAGPGRALAGLAAQCCPLPVISTGSVSSADSDGRRKDAAGANASSANAAGANAAAALFAAGAASSLRPLFARRSARPIDVWREREFATEPCASAVSHAAERGASRAMGGAPASARPRGCPGDQDHGDGGDQAPHEDAEIPGIGPWIRCFAEVRDPVTEPTTPPPSGPWRVRVTPRQPFGKIIGDTFTDSPDADCVLACVAGAGDPDAAVLLFDAAREALGCDGLVVISHGGGLAGFLRSLHAEHPRLGITLLRVAQSQEGLRRARRFSTAAPGVFREIVVADDDHPVLVSAAPVTVTGAGATPLAAADVVLLTGGADGMNVACAEVIAGTGAAVALVGRGDPADDPAVKAGLDRLRGAGACAGYEPADVTDPAAVRAAVRRLEERLGPVTALVHCAAHGSPRPFADLTADDVDAELRPGMAGLISALDAVRPGRLRLVVTFGSLAGWYGQAGACHHSLARAVLRDQAARLARQVPGCRVLHIDWPAWSGTDGPGLADMAGTAPATAGVAPVAAGVAAIPAAEAGVMLLRLIASSGPAEAVAVHGRAGLAPARIASPGRFVQAVRVHYPGVELVADAALDLESDPYLGDYCLDGQASLPAALGLEAMAQAAAVLAARPLRRARDVALASPVAIGADGAARIRVCALHHGDRVETVLRSADTGYRTEHMRAVFPLVGAAPGNAAVNGNGAPLASAPGRRGRNGRLVDHVSTGIVDGTELYGPLCFQTGRFRRVAFLPELTSRSYRALVRGADDARWFGPDFAQRPLLLGSPGVNDAAIHALQACMPHRRLKPSGCQSITMTGLMIDGAVECRARERPATADESVWDVEAFDTHGQRVAAWNGLRVADAGPLRHAQPWPPALLAAYLERGAIGLGLDPTLHVTVRAGHPRQLSCGCAGGGLLTSAGAGWLGASADPGGLLGSVGAGGLRTSGLFFVSGRQSGRGCHSHLDGLALRADAACRVACEWAPTGARGDGSLPGVPGWQTVFERLRDRCGERPDTLRARIRTAAACLTKAGLPAGSPVTVGAVHDDGWILLRAADNAIASTVVMVSGVPAALAVSIMTRSA